MSPSRADLKMPSPRQSAASLTIFSTQRSAISPAGGAALFCPCRRAVHGRSTSFFWPSSYGRSPSSPCAPAARSRTPSRSRRRRETRAERRRHDVRHLGADVDSDLVEQLHRPDREAELHQRAVDVLHRGAVVEDERRLVHVGPEDARGVEPGAVVDHDDGLANLLAQRHHRAPSPARPRRADDFQQRHLVDRREEVHADHFLGPLRRFRDAAR